jgi:uroporphyrinogen-III synthase
MPSTALHRHHRARLIERLQQRAAAGIFFTSAHKIRNFDA